MGINTNALENITATTTETSLVVTPVDKCIVKSFFLINQGGNIVDFRIYGSPTGIIVGDTLPNSSTPYTQAIIDLHYILVATVNITANNNHMLDLTDYIFNFFKLTVQSTTGTSIINYCLQQAYALV